MAPMWKKGVNWTLDYQPPHNAYIFFQQKGHFVLQLKKVYSYTCAQRKMFSIFFFGITNQGLIYHKGPGSFLH